MTASLQFPGTPASYPVLDIHHHLAVDEGFGRDDLLKRRFGLMDRFGVDRVLIMPPSGAFGTRQPAALLNDRTAELVARYPERFAGGFACVSSFDSEELQAAEIRRATGELGLVGVVWHHRFEGVFLDHPSMPAALRVCAEVGVPALVHVVGESALESAWRLRSLLAQACNATVVALDAFSTLERGGELIQLATEYPNLYCDLGTMSSACAFNVAYFVERIGDDRLLLGTDLYVDPQSYAFPYAIYEVLAMELTDEAKRQILHGNARRLFRLAA